MITLEAMQADPIAKEAVRYMEMFSRYMKDDEERLNLRISEVEQNQLQGPEARERLELLRMSVETSLGMVNSQVTRIEKAMGCCEAQLPQMVGSQLWDVRTRADAAFRNVNRALERLN